MLNITFAEFVSAINMGVHLLVLAVIFFVFYIWFESEARPKCEIRRFKISTFVSLSLAIISSISITVTFLFSGFDVMLVALITSPISLLVGTVYFGLRSQTAHQNCENNNCETLSHSIK